MRKITICILFSVFFLANGSTKIDSLVGLLKTTKDTKRICDIKKAIAWKFIFSNPDTSRKLSFENLELAKKIDYKKAQAAIYYNIGVSYAIQSQFDLAIEYYYKSYNLYKVLGNELGIAKLNNAIGNVYFDQGEYGKAIDNYLDALEIYEKNNYKKGITKSYNNIGNVYNAQKLYDKAISYYEKSLKIKEELGDKRGIAGTSNNIASIYQKQLNNEKAIIYYNKSLSLKKALNDTKGVAMIHQNLGVLYKELNDYESALANFEIAEEILKKLNDKRGLSSLYHNLSNLFFDFKQYDKALKYENKAYQLSKEIGAKNNIKVTALGLSDVYEIIGKLDSSLKYYKIYNAIKDSLLNEKNTRQQIQAELEYEYQKRQNKLLLEEQISEKLALEKIETSNRITVTVVTALLAVLVVLFLLIKALNSKKQINTLLEAQKNTLKEKNKEIISKNKSITNNIEVAARIQKAILPSRNQIAELFKEYLLIYLPKNIISGDLYWVYAHKDCKIVAVADCTGHGVRAALVSMVAHNGLNNIIKERKIVDTSEILVQLNIYFKKFFQDQNKLLSDNSIDISILKITNNNWQYSGANTTMILASENDCFDFRGDSYIIGLENVEKNYFNKSEGQLSEKDTIWLYTDGILDQFGEKTKRKFLKKRLLEFIKNNKKYTLAKQEQLLIQEIQNWKGSLDQIDDICVFAFKN